MYFGKNLEEILYYQLPQQKEMNYRRHEAEINTKPLINTLSYFLPSIRWQVLQLYRTHLIFSKIK